MALPRVIAGPVVRRVERTSCSFWVVLREQATVTAKVWKDHQQAPVADSVPLVASGQVTTRRAGAALHVAVVTVDTSGAPLEAGALYSYDLSFQVGSSTTNLKDEKLLENEGETTRIDGVDPMAPLALALGFQKDRLPSFLAPPATFAPTSPATAAAGLRLAHASCRRPGSGAVDALGGLAPLVADDARRPHQLHLTGDQVYADDVTTSFFVLCAALGEELAGLQALPGFPPDPRTGGSGPTPVTGAGLPGSRANLPALRRQWLLWQLAGFTGGDTSNHLITFPEFVAHHLLAWSPRIWRAIPTFEQGFVTTPAPAAAIEPWLNKPWFCGDGVDATQPEATLQQRWVDKAQNVDGFEGFNRGARQVARYAAATPAVAQVLANTPTYMIFDDHEIADDWNLNGRWAARVYNREWGRFVVRNGLLAYALMQGWGNEPEHFTKDDEAGRKLLDAIPAVLAAAPTEASTKDVDVLLGFDPPTDTIKKRVRWNFSIKATDHSVVVLDTRTHRDVSSLTLEAPNLVANLDEQLPARAATDTTTQLLVVISPVPVFGPSVIEQLGQPLAQLIIDLKNDHHVGEVPGFRPGDQDDPALKAGCGGRVERGGEKYDREGWSANELGFEQLLARLATYPAVVLLSGDVHYGCTMALDYWAKGRATPTRIVQCTSSPSKNTFKAQIEEAVRQDGTLQRGLEVPIERIAWNEIDADDLVPAGTHLPLARRSRLRRKPAIVPSAVWPVGTKIPETKEPDWRWRITAVIDTTTRVVDLPPTLQPRVIAETTEEKPPVDRFVDIATLHQQLVTEGKPRLRRVVFLPNFGTVSFELDIEIPVAVHRIHSANDVITFDADEAKPLPAERPAPPPQLAFLPNTAPPCPAAHAERCRRPGPDRRRPAGARRWLTTPSTRWCGCRTASPTPSTGSTRRSATRP